MTPLTYTVAGTALRATAASPTQATGAYQAAASLGDASPSGFGAALNRAIGGAIASGEQADKASAAAIAGTGSVTQVVTALSRAELALQTTTALRDRMVQAYQDIMRMPI